MKDITTKKTYRFVGYLIKEYEQAQKVCENSQTMNFSSDEVRLKRCLSYLEEKHLLYGICFKIGKSGIKMFNLAFSISNTIQNDSNNLSNFLCATSNTTSTTTELIETLIIRKEYLINLQQKIYSHMSWFNKLLLKWKI